MSFLGIYSLFLRRSAKPCRPPIFDPENILWKRGDFIFKQPSLLEHILRSSQKCLQACSPLKRFSKAQELWDILTERCNEKLVLFGGILTQQCHFYAAQRLVRMTQVGSFYHRLYTRRTVQHMVARLVKRLKSERTKSLGMILGATLFSWETEKITEKDLKRCVDEFDQLTVCKQRGGNSGKLAYPVGDNMCDVEQEEKQSWSVSQLRSEGWEPVIQRDQLQVWRKAVSCSYLYEYKVFGTFYDIPARAFFSVQMDTDYRKKWDKLVISLDIIDKDEKEGCEVIHWVMHYPFPMYSRDYVYMRRALVDQDQGIMVLMSKAIDHPLCPADKKYVRVKKYFSQMVIRPHKNFDESGFDYLLSYFDDPEAAFPAPAYNWMASSGVPDFVEKLHGAARGLYFQNNDPVTPESQGPSLCHHKGPSLQQVYA